MRDIRSDLRERLEATVKQRNELNGRVRALEAQEQRLRALLNDEEFSHVHQLPLASCPPSSEATGGGRLREFVLGSLQDGHDWSLQDLKEQAHGIGLTTVGASGRSLNITLVNLLRGGLGHAGEQRAMAVARPSHAVAPRFSVLEHRFESRE